MNKPPATKSLDPFSLHIFWDGSDGRSPESVYTTYIKGIYEFFNRAENDPLDIYLGIPVYLHPEPVAEVAHVITESSAQSCSLVFIDAQMTEEESWLNCLRELKKVQDTSTQHLLLPLSLTKKKIRFLGRTQYVKLKNSGLTVEEFLIRIAHSTYRHLEPKTVSDAKEAMQIFISHAKVDGKEFAKGLKDRIDDIPELKSFYDVKNISWGSDFDSEIENNISRSVFLVLHTDKFSSREWCRQEVIYAKQHDRPVLVVNQFKEGEGRSFPYLGNVPHLRFSEDAKTATEEQLMYDLILLSVIAEGLRLRIYDLSIHQLSKNLGISIDEVFNYPPELLTVLRKEEQQKKSVIVYPDPPLGKAEQGVLKAAHPELTFITPTFLPLLSEDGQKYHDLKGLHIGLSLSEISGNSYKWIDYNIIQDVTSALARYLLVGGAVFHYGGSLHYNQAANDKTYNFVHLLKLLVQTYRNDFGESSSSDIKPIENYTFVPDPALIDADEKEAMENLINFHEIPPHEIFKLSAEQAVDVGDLKNESPHFGLFEKRTIWAISLMEMRRKMLKKENARIVLGGKWDGFISRMSGILEEVVMSLEQEKPLYILGGFGGVSAGIAACLQGNIPAELHAAYYAKNDPDYFDFLERFNELSLVKRLNAACDYDVIANAIKDRAAGKPDFGLNNGLNREENLRLFESKSTMEIVCLVLKGMHALKLTTAE